MKQHTIIFVPHTRAKLRKWRFSSLQAAFAGGALAFLFLVSVGATVIYLTASIDRDELQRIERENQDLLSVNQRFEQNIQDLENKLDDYQQRIHKLAIVAGLAELSPGTEAGIGGLDMGEELTLDGELQALQVRADGLGDDMSLLHETFAERNALIASTPAVSPVKGLLTSGFGFRSDPFTGRRTLHTGLDIVAPPGKEVHATGDGIVTHAGRIGALGNAVYLSHGNGITTRYGHLSRVTVQPGAEVKRGDVLGHVGNSGRSTGYHLHYEVRLEGKPTNPLGYILDDPRP